MRQVTTTWGPIGKLATRRGAASLVLAAAGLALAACGASGQSGGTATAAAATSSAATKDVKTGTTSLGTILVNPKGFSLYRLSGEKKGHFICTGSCTQTWHPLKPRKGKSP